MTNSASTALPRGHWFGANFRPCKDACIAAYMVLTRDQLRNIVPAAACIRTSSGLYRVISSEAPTTALLRERSCAARTRRFLSAAIPLIDSPSTQSATTSHSSLSGEERNIRLFGSRCPGVRPLSPTRSRGWSGLVSNCARPLPSEQPPSRICSRFIQNVHSAAGRPFREFAREFDSLRLASGQDRGRLAQFLLGCVP